MQLHQLKRKTKNLKSRQVGRGGKRGKTSGRGTKGQKARAGHKIRPESRDFIKKLPKLRGRGKNIFQSFQTKPVPLNLYRIDAAFAAGEAVNPQTLAEKKVVSKQYGAFRIIKILSQGEITKPVVVSGCTVSAPAKAKIEKAGGKVTEIVLKQIQKAEGKVKVLK